MVTKESEKWNTWIAYITATTCEKCRELNGKIFDKYQSIKMPPIYPNCRCKVDRLKTVVAGTVNVKGKNGADWWLYYKKKLPEDYITKEWAEKLGWNKTKGNLAKVAPGKMLGGNMYKNKNEKLPKKKGR